MEITRDILDTFNQNTLYTTLGIHIEDAHNGKARSRLVPQPDVCWPMPQRPHGGVLFTLMDTTMGWAIESQLDQGLSCTTVSLNIHFTQPAQNAPFMCSTWVVHETGRMRFLQGEILDAEEGVIATGHGVFRVVKFDMSQL